MFDRVTIGRSSECTIQLLDEKVSRVHSRIDRDGEHFVVQDAGSSNGTGLNGRRLEAPKVLEPGDEVAVGSNLLMYEPTVDILRDLSGSGNVLLLCAPERVATDAGDLDRAPKEVGAKTLIEALQEAMGGPRGLGRGANLVETLARCLGADRAALLRCAADGSDVQAVATYPAQGRVGLRNDRLKEAITAGTAQHRVDGSVEHAVKQAKTVVVGHVGSTLYVPLKHRDQVRGLFFADIRTPDGFDYVEMEALLAACTLAFSAFLGPDPFAHLRFVADEKAIETPVARSPRMQEALSQARKLASGNLPLLIEGPAGTGKAFMGRFIHSLSERAALPYLAVRCDRLGGSNSDQTLFGKDTSGSESADTGIMDEVQSGTILLDAVECLEPALQMKILRTVQEERFFRVGGVRPVRSRVRILLGTAASLSERVEDESFMSDLYAEVRDQRLALPSLDERTADLEPLIKRFVARFNRDTGCRMKGFAGEAIERMEKHQWTENVRELKECVDHLLCRAESDIVQASEVDSELAVSVHRGVGGANLARALAGLDRDEITQCLARGEGQSVKAAAILGVPVNQFRRRAALLGIPLDDN